MCRWMYASALTRALCAAAHKRCDAMHTHVQVQEGWVTWTWTTPSGLGALIRQLTHMRNALLQAPWHASPNLSCTRSTKGLFPRKRCMWYLGISTAHPAQVTMALHRVRHDQIAHPLAQVATSEPDTCPGHMTATGQAIRGACAGACTPPVPTPTSDLAALPPPPAVVPTYTRSRREPDLSVVISTAKHRPWTAGSVAKQAVSLLTASHLFCLPSGPGEHVKDLSPGTRGNDSLVYPLPIVTMTAK